MQSYCISRNILISFADKNKLLTNLRLNSVVLQHLLQVFALALFLRFAVGETGKELADDDADKAQGVDANHHAAALLFLATFLQPVALVGQLHISLQLRRHDDHGDGGMLFLGQQPRVDDARGGWQRTAASNIAKVGCQGFVGLFLQRLVL